VDDDAGNVGHPGEPGLPPIEEAPVEIRTPDELEQHLGDLSTALPAPGPAECVLCHVERMLAAFGCDGMLRGAARRGAGATCGCRGRPAWNAGWRPAAASATARCP
jgi:hypothetical protein